MTERDGYYAMSAICIAVGIALLVTFVLPTARRLQRELLSATCIYTAVTGLDDLLLGLPMSAWRVKIPQ
jgi:hypothetical protein